jgi:hypothetical protein
MKIFSFSSILNRYFTTFSNKTVRFDSSSNKLEIPVEFPEEKDLKEK